VEPFRAQFLFKQALFKLFRALLAAFRSTSPLNLIGDHLSRAEGEC